MRTGPSKVGTLLTRDPDDKTLHRTDAMIEMVANLAAFRADVLILDPLAELHTDEGSATVQLRDIVAEFRALAREMNMAVVLVHHTRKGIVVPGKGLRPARWVAAALFQGRRRQGKLQPANAMRMVRAGTLSAGPRRYCWRAQAVVPAA